MKTKPCLLSMESLASALDETVKSPSAKPSALIWGRIKHLFKPFAFTYASALAELQESRQVFLSAVQEAKCATMQIHCKSHKISGVAKTKPQWLQPTEYDEALQRSSKPCYADTISRIKKQWAYIQWAQTNT
ncbi:hypothetical protein EYZ11_010906 [Aspergillus tanneri]|uniref:Uncharacterized protein n=1 Tax=Aspergillus tanneri TaxID=1220188 RepID=A0A4S3J452_9EURO|nr:hypothetical protein EYZ11_010906 [Aspergillus tanneri]